MDYKIEKMNSLKFIGVMKEFNNETAYQEVPKYWDEVYQVVIKSLEKNNFSPSNDIEKAFLENNIGEYALCIDDGISTFKYMICGEYKGGCVPEGMVVYEVPSLEWAIFKAIGPLPNALQTVNTKIYKEWLPNSKYLMSNKYSIEWYGMGNTNSDDYESAIWIPVKEK